MSSAVLRIQVATLADVPDGVSRIDGVPNQLVTLTSVGSGSTHLIRFLDVTNPGIAGATSRAPSVPALTPVGDGRTFTFMPPGGAGAFGQSFRIELVVDLGLKTEVRSERVYKIPTVAGLIYPVYGEGADPEASIINAGTAQIAASTDNSNGNFRGFHPSIVDFMSSLSGVAGGASGWTSPVNQNVFGTPQQKVLQASLVAGVFAVATAIGTTDTGTTAQLQMTDGTSVQVQTYQTPAAPANGTYIVTINNVAVTVTASGLTQSQLTVAMVAAINASGLSVVAAGTTTSFTVTALFAGMPFTSTLSGSGQGSQPITQSTTTPVVLLTFTHAGAVTQTATQNYTNTIAGRIVQFWLAATTSDAVAICKSVTLQRTS